MAIFTGFGNSCTIVKRSESGPMEYDEKLTVRRTVDGKEIDYHAGELKADGGIKEIAEAVEAL